MVFSAVIRALKFEFKSFPKDPLSLFYPSLVNKQHKAYCKIPVIFLKLTNARNCSQCLWKKKAFCMKLKSAMKLFPSPFHSLPDILFVFDVPLLVFFFKLLLLGFSPTSHTALLFKVAITCKSPKPVNKSYFFFLRQSNSIIWYIWSHLPRWTH